MSGIFGAFAGWLGGGSRADSEEAKSRAVMDQANALYEKYRHCKPVLGVNSIAFGYNNTSHNTAIDLSVVVSGPPPGIYWTQRTNRQSTVEIVR